MPQPGNMQGARHATTGGVSWAVAILRITWLRHVQTVVQYSQVHRINYPKYVDYNVLSIKNIGSEA